MFKIRTTAPTFSNITVQPKPFIEIPIVKQPIKDGLANENFFKGPALIDPSRGDPAIIGDFGKKAKGPITADRIGDVERMIYDTRKNFFRISNDVPDSSVPFSNFKAYEQLTGLSTSRPQILMSTTFRPLFEKHFKSVIPTFRNEATRKFTETGELFDAQIQLFNLKYEAFLKLIADMKSNPEAQKLLIEGETQFIQHIDAVSANVKFLKHIQKSVDDLKDVMNLRSVRSRTLNFDNLLKVLYKKTDPSVMQIVNSFENNVSMMKFLSDCSFDESKIVNFSNTKLYLQSLLELKRLLICISDEIIGVDTSKKLADNDSTTITKTSFYDINGDLSRLADATMQDLRTVGNVDLETFVEKVSKTFQTFVNLPAASQDDRVAMLYQIVSKEYTYSRAFSNEQFLSFCDQSYGYKAALTQNSKVFDSIIGHSGGTIVDPATSPSANASMLLAQQDKTDFVVLPLELDYVENNSDVFSPGGIFYIDQMLKVTEGGFDVANANELRVLVERQHNLQSSLYKYLVPGLQSNFFPDTFAGENLRDSVTMFKACILTFVDGNTNLLRPEFSKSNLGLLFDVAKTDVYLKSLIFIYFSVLTIGISNDDAFQLIARGVLDDVVKGISKRLGELIVPTNNIVLGGKIQVQNELSKNSISSIELELKNKSSFVTLFAARLDFLFDAFGTGKCIKNDALCYSGMSTFTLYALLFEMLFSTFERLNEKIAFGQGPVGNSFMATSGQKQNDRIVITPRDYYFNKNIFVNSIERKLKLENSKILKGIMSHLGFLSALKAGLRNNIEFLQRDETVKGMNNILKIVETGDQFSLILTENQLNVIKNATDDIYARYDAKARAGFEKENNKLDVASSYMRSSKNDLVLFDDFLIPNDTKNAIYEYFSDQKFSIDKGFNSRILSVGIPSDFSKFLREKVPLKSLSDVNYSPKQFDVVKVKVYKIDVRYQDIIFKPQTFLFELSRFVSKDYSSYRSVSDGSAISDIEEAIPTRDHSFVDSNSDQILCYGRENNPLFTSTEYDFLEDSQKESIIKNHIQSHMLELYIKLLTGFAVNELDFWIDDSFLPTFSMSPIVVQKLVEREEEKNPEPEPTNEPFLTGEFLPNKNTFHGKIEQPISTYIASTPTQKKPEKENQSNVIVEVAKSKSIYSDGLLESRKLMKPKMFDRIFNIIVDPDDFYIDIDETIKNDTAKATLESLFSAGAIVEDGKQTIMRSLVAHANSNFKFIEKSPRENDPVFEKYFITVETVFSELV